MNQLTELLREDGKIWVVVAVVSVVLLGWLFYLLRIGRRVHKIKRRVRGS
ncbi:CcmD family protein [Spirosoma sp. KNUC1025]